MSPGVPLWVLCHSNRAHMKRGLKMTKKLRFMIFVALLVIICGFLFACFYSVAKREAIDDLTKEQSLHARQAAQGIEEFFGNWTRTLETFSRMDGIVSLDDKGRQYMALLYEANKDQIRSVTRVDAGGRVSFTTPFSGDTIGKDISGQKHIREMMRSHSTTVSDVFRTVQGFDAVALHVPVFRHKAYAGSIGVTVNFASLAKRYLDGIRIGSTAHVWMISRDGTELFSPFPGHTGRSVLENYRESPLVLAMAKEMMKGHQGVAAFSFDGRAEQAANRDKKLAVFVPIPIGNTFWSIAVASSEDEVLASLANFRNRLFLIIAFILFGATAFTYYGGKAWSIIREEEKRRRAEEALKNEHKRLEQIIDFLPDPTLVIDKRGIVTAWNRAIEKMTGVKAKEMIGRGDYEYGVPFYGERRPLLIDLALSGDNEFLKEHYDELGRQNGILSGEVFVPKTYGGEGAYLWATASTLYNGDGSVIGAIESIHDITRRKALESALRESEEKYRTLVENANSIILRMDTIGTITFFNDYASQFLGFSREEIIGRNVIGTIVPPTDSAGKDLSKMILDIAVRREFYRNNENENMCKNGARVWVAWTNTPVLDDQGRCVEILCIGNDITERRRMQDELLRAQKLESLGLLAGGIAHDFNNILTGIVGNISVAKLQLDPSHEISKRLELCEKAAMQATELTRQLLTFARGGEPVKRLIIPTSLIRETVSFALRGSNIISDIHIQDDLWSMEVDESQLSQVLNNLLLNAIQAMPAGGEVVVRAVNESVPHENGHQLAQGDYIRISVEDRGCGIPQQDLVKIFDPYFTTKPKGSGLGLASVYSIVKRHGGGVKVKSIRGIGSVFTILLPALPGRSPEDAVIKAPAELRGVGRILVMDDEEAIREIVTYTLEFLGFEVESCGDGREAVDWYRRGLANNAPFSAVILDLTIPGGMGGKEAAARILEIDPGAVLIVSSGYYSDPVMANFRDFGFKGAVPKPFDAEGLARELKILIPMPT